MDIEGLATAFSAHEFESVLPHIAEGLAGSTVTVRQMRAVDSGTGTRSDTVELPA